LRRSHLKENVDTGQTTDAAPWHKLSWPLVRWANNKMHACNMFLSLSITKGERRQHFWQV